MLPSSDCPLHTRPIQKKISRTAPENDQYVRWGQGKCLRIARIVEDRAYCRGCRPFRATHKSHIAIGTAMTRKKVGTLKRPSEREFALKDKCTG